MTTRQEVIVGLDPQDVPKYVTAVEKVKSHDLFIASETSLAVINGKAVTLFKIISDNPMAFVLVGFYAAAGPDRNWNEIL